MVHLILAMWKRRVEFHGAAVLGGEVGCAGGGPARGGAKGWIWEARAEARKVAGSSVLGKGGRIGGFPSGRRAAVQEVAGGLAGHARGAGLCPL